MSFIELEHVCKTYDGVTFAIEDFSFRSLDNEFVTIVGSSGCGKTTLLRVVAGLESLTTGRIFIDGIDVTDLEPKRRKISMVFQDYALYPHMSVYDNIAFPLHVARMGKLEIQSEVNRITAMLDLNDCLERKPNTLSGGQQQRVAIARAIISKPSILLFDEPLSNVDANLKERLKELFISLHEQLCAVFLYVTHDQNEAMSLGDRLIVMDKGSVQQVSSPFEVYTRPQNTFVAKFIGRPSINILPKDVFFQAFNCEVDLPDNVTAIGIRPEHIQITRQVQIDNEWLLVRIENAGKERNFYLECGASRLVVNTSGAIDCDISVGDAVSCTAMVEHILFFDSLGRLMN